VGHEVCSFRGVVGLLLRQLNITTHDAGALLAGLRLGGASTAPIIDMFYCLSNNCSFKYHESHLHLKKQFRVGVEGSINVKKQR
jgi:hypothetical protein